MVRDRGSRSASKKEWLPRRLGLLPFSRVEVPAPTTNVLLLNAFGSPMWSQWILPHHVVSASDIISNSDQGTIYMRVNDIVNIIRSKSTNFQALNYIGLGSQWLPAPYMLLDWNGIVGRWMSQSKIEDEASHSP